MGASRHNLQDTRGVCVNDTHINFSLICCIQEQYNALYEGAEFDLESRYALLLNTLFVTLLFSTGLPILVAFAAGNFILTCEYIMERVSLVGYPLESL